MELNEKNKDYIFVRCDSAFIKIRLKDILYIKAEGDYVHVYTTEKNKVHTLHCGLKNMEERLPASKFYRIHRSCLIALDHIDKVEKNKAYIGEIDFQISVNSKKQLLEKLNLVTQWGSQDEF